MDQNNYLRATLRLQVALVGGIGTLLTIVAQTAQLSHEQTLLIERSVNHLSEAIDAAQALVQERDLSSEEKH